MAVKCELRKGIFEFWEWLRRCDEP